jgi:hypothetical protein
LNDLQPTPLADAKFGKSTNPRWLAGDFRDLGPLAGLQHVQRK